MSDLQKLSRRLGIEFRDEKLYQEALTHKSFSAEYAVGYDNERMEFLGDAVVQIILTDYLFRRYPKFQEGDLTKLRSALANQSTLADFGRELQVGACLRLGRGEKEFHGEDRESTVSDAFEAVMGAIYLDQGLETARRVFLAILERLVPEPDSMLCEINPKGVLQEYTQQRSQGVPQYQVISVSGPDHDPRYEVEVLIQGKPIARATSGSRKHAEKEAARLALKLLADKENPS